MFKTMNFCATTLYKTTHRTFKLGDNSYYHVTVFHPSIASVSESFQRTTDGENLKFLYKYIKVI